MNQEEKKEMLKMNKGIFHFLAKNNLNIGEKRRMLHMYGKFKGLERPKKTNKRNAWYVEVSNLAQENFTEFKKVFNKHKPRIKKQSYDDWWDECNTDGTFAYNGVTEDF